MIGTRRWLTGLMALAWTSGFTGLGLSAQTPVELNRPDSIHVGARDISGTWEGTFRLDSAWQLPERASARSVPARLHFDPQGTLLRVEDVDR